MRPSLLINNLPICRVLLFFAGAGGHGHSRLWPLFDLPGGFCVAQGSISIKRLWSYTGYELQVVPFVTPSRDIRINPFHVRPR
jgi:hypothetical protein